ncbi:MAG: hypothetical protein NC355_04210 [Blautia sp.]|nr:hypothetical protein [Blautia sp.]
MNRKRIAAFMTAATMLLNVTPVMAAEFASPSATQTATSSGTVNAYDKTPQYKVTLPTSNALQFTVDPYGLLELEDGDSINIDELSNSGAIVAASGSGAVIKNQSSVPVTISMKLYAEDSSNTIQLKSDADEVASGSGTNMLLAVIPSADKAASASEYTAASYGIPVTQNAATNVDASFKLDKAAYKVTNNGGKFEMSLATDSATNYDATTFKVGGCVNPDGDWSPFVATAGGTAATLTLGVVFEYAEAPSTDEVDNDKAYGLVSGSAAAITDKLGSAGGSEYTRTWTSGDLTFTIPANAKTIQWIEIDGVSMSRGFSVSYDGGTTLTIPAKEFAGGWKKAKLKVGYADSSLDVIINVTNGN